MPANQQQGVPMSNIRTQAYRRENRCDIDIEKFAMHHGTSSRSNRDVIYKVELRGKIPAMDEEVVMLSAIDFNDVKAAARRYGCQTVGDSLSPAEGAAMLNALETARAESTDKRMVDAYQAVIRVLRWGRGLKVV
jgi:hypothetical protein